MEMCAKLFKEPVKRKRVTHYTHDDKNVIFYDDGKVHIYGVKEPINKEQADTLYHEIKDLLRDQMKPR